MTQDPKQYEGDYYTALEKYNASRKMYGAHNPFTKAREADMNAAKRRWEEQTKPPSSE